METVQLTQEQKNIIFAEFMGKDIGHTNMVIDTKNWETIKYDSDLNWLNAVEDKIMRMGFSIQTLSTPTISGKWFSHKVTITPNNWFAKPIVEVDSDYSNNESKISLVYRAYLAFIELYNKAQK